MAISRVPGFSLLANLDRQGTDLSLTSSGQTLQYWDVTNYRIGINNQAPQQELDVTGNIITSNGHVLTNANLSYDIGNQYNWWRTVYAETINSNNLTGTLLTNAQPNITSIGTLSNLAISGNLTAPYFYGNLLGNVTGTILTNAQPYINSLGTLSDLTVTGNVTAPTFNGNVYGNVTGTILTNAQPYIDTLGTLTNLNVTGNILANNITSSTITGTLLTNAQPNITSLGTLANLSVAGNLSVNGNLIVGGVTVDNLSANNITADIFGNITGYVLQGDQPFITNLANITVNTITILGGNLVVGGNVNFDYVNANVMFQGGNQVLDTATNIQISGDTVGYGNVANIYVELATTGVGAGVYGDDGIFPQISVDSKGRILSAANISLSKVANLNFIDTTISSNTDITISTTSNGNIILDASGTGTVQFTGTDAVGLPSGGDATRPANPEIGYLRFNTDRDAIEYWTGTQWEIPGESYISSEIINPDGAGNTFVMTQASSADAMLVSINGTIQQPYTAYNVSGYNIIFTEVPEATDRIEIRHIAIGSGVTVTSLVLGNISVSLDTANVNVVGNLHLSQPLSVQYGGTGGANANVALQNLLPTTTNYGYVLTTNGAGSYYWAEGTPGPAGTIDTTYESLAQNMNAYPYTINRTGSTITDVTYTVGGNTIVKEFTYNGSGQIESIAIYGTPLGSTVYTKNLTYSGTSVSSVSYSIL
jgi:hypothetical protein